MVYRKTSKAALTLLRSCWRTDLKNFLVVNLFVKNEAQDEWFVRNVARLRPHVDPDDEVAETKTKGWENDQLGVNNLSMFTVVPEGFFL